MPQRAVPIAVKVRALALVHEDGEYAVIGYPDATDEGLIKEAELLIGDGAIRRHWIEMELELPSK